MPKQTKNYWDPTSKLQTGHNLIHKTIEMLESEYLPKLLGAD